MRKSIAAFVLFTALMVMAAPAYSITVKDYSTVLKTVKKLDKLAKKGDLEEMSKYYSENYKSFDGYGKKELIKIFEISSQLFPSVKSKEKITRVDTKNDTITVYIDEHSKAKMDVSGVEARYALDNKIKGRMNSYSKYAMIFKKEDDGIWRVAGDKVFYERTDIKYGEAIKTPFVMETPDMIKSGEEYTVKATLQMPENRLVVGAIGHDAIVFPPVKYPDPFRAVDKTGVLERIMIANKDGMNEYANYTYAFIVPVKLTNKKTKREITKAAISGMGLVVKRVNTDKENLL